MRERVALILACAAASAVLALLVHGFIYPIDISGLEPDMRFEYAMSELNAKKELLLLLFGGLIAWIASRD